MIHPNRLISLAFVGVVLMDAVLTIALGQPLSELYYVPLVIPILMALHGRGGRFFYYFALALTWYLSSGLVFFVMGAGAAIMGAVQISPGDPVPYVLLAFGTLGFSAYFCITRTHPMANNKTRLNHKLRAQRESFMFSVIVSLVNCYFMLLTIMVNPEWSFPEVIWVYWFDTVILLFFSYRTMRQLNNFDVSDITGIPGKSDEEIKQNYVHSFTVAYMAFMGVYACLFLWLLHIHTLLNTGIIFLLVMAASVLHFHEYQVKRRELATRCVNLQHLHFVQPFRLLPMHLTLIIALPAYAAGQGEELGPGFLLLFIFAKTLADLLTEALGYRKSRQLALESYG